MATGLRQAADGASGSDGWRKTRHRLIKVTSEDPVALRRYRLLVVGGKTDNGSLRHCIVAPCARLQETVLVSG